MDSTEAYVFFFPLMLSCFQGCSCSILYHEHHGLCPVFTILFIHQTLWLPHFKLKLKKIYLNVSVTTQRRHKTGIQDHFRLIDSFMFKSIFFFYVIKVQGERLEQLPCHFHPASVSALLTSPPGCLHTSLCVRGWDCASSPQRSITQAAPVFVLIPSVTCSL